MNELSKITSEHLHRCAIVYVRQSSTTQVEHNRESTARQYALAERAAKLGWQRDQIKVIDEDLGISGSGLAERTGFARMTAEVPSAKWASCSAWKCHDWRAIMPTGTVCSISVA
jgi:DNA invertase Pin-like site-specific DNA recombinase